MRNFGDEIEFKKDGIIQKRAQDVVVEAADFIAEVEETGLMNIIEQGKFAGVKRPRDGGKGLEGVAVKDAVYFNPFVDLMLGGER